MLKYRIVRFLAGLRALFVADKVRRRQVRDATARRLLAGRAWYRTDPPTPHAYELAVASRLLQDAAFPAALATARKVIAVVVPERDEMNGGIHSLFSIAAELRRQKRAHGFEVVVVTRPQAAPITHFRNTRFTNAETVFRFPQLMRCAALEELMLVIPEFVASDLVDGLEARERRFLAGLSRLRIHVLNQNIDLMPPRAAVDRLRALTPVVTQSVAHHAYFTREVAERWGLPTMLLPAFTDLSPYPPASFAEKEKLIIHSPDPAPHKAAVLAALVRELPDYELREIRGISFDTFMDLATRCMFSVTFGEGFDGYFSQPIQQGGLSFAIFEERFFPSKDLGARENMLRDGDDMIARLPGLIRAFSGDEARYRAVGDAWRATIDALYDREDYRRRIGELVRGEFPYDGRPAEA